MPAMDSEAPTPQAHEAIPGSPPDGVPPARPAGSPFPVAGGGRPMPAPETVLAFDRLPLARRETTPEGYLVAPGVLSRTGIQTYYAYELGLDAGGMDPMRRVRLHRPPEEVFDPGSLATFKNLPVTVGHPPNGVDAANWRKTAVGDCRGGLREGDTQVGTVTVRDAQAVEAVRDGTTELSCGYTFALDLTPGTDPVSGQPYDGIQRRIRGNHVALVDAGRCGSACRIADALPHTPEPGDNLMPDPIRKTVVDGIPIELNDTAAAAVDKLLKERDAAKTAADAALKGKADAEKALADATKAHQDAVGKLATDHAAKVAELEKDVLTPAQRDAMVRDWAEMLADAKRLAPMVATDGKTCVDVRRAVVKDVGDRNATAQGVIAAILAGKALEAADADTVRAAFNAVKALPIAHANDDGRADGFTQALAGVKIGDGPPVADARTLFHQNMADYATGH